MFHHSGNAKSHAREGSTAQESQNPTCRKSPSLRNRAFSRAVVVYRSGIAKSHARDQSIAQESRNPTRRNVPPLRNYRIPRAVVVHRTRAVIKNLIYHNPSHTKK